MRRYLLFNIKHFSPSTESCSIEIESTSRHKGMTKSFKFISNVRKEKFHH